jgi:hypothetical protein
MATSPNATPTPITPPRVPFINERTGLIDRAWYLFFLSLFNTSAEVDAAFSPDTSAALATYDALLRDFQQTVETTPPAPVEQLAELAKAVDALAKAPVAQVLPPASALSDGYLTSTDWIRFNAATDGALADRVLGWLTLNSGVWVAH